MKKVLDVRSGYSKQRICIDTTGALNFRKNSGKWYQSMVCWLMMITTKQHCTICHELLLRCILVILIMLKYRINIELYLFSVVQPLVVICIISDLITWHPNKRVNAFVVLQEPIVLALSGLTYIQIVIANWFVKKTHYHHGLEFETKDKSNIRV